MEKKRKYRRTDERWNRWQGFIGDDRVGPEVTAVSERQAIFRISQEMGISIDGLYAVPMGGRRQEVNTVSREIPQKAVVNILEQGRCPTCGYLDPSEDAYQCPNCESRLTQGDDLLSIFELREQNQTEV